MNFLFYNIHIRHVIYLLFAHRNIIITDSFFATKNCDFNLSAKIVKKRDTRNLAHLRQRDTPARFRATATTGTPGLMAAQINLANLMP